MHGGGHSATQDFLPTPPGPCGALRGAWIEEGTLPAAPSSLALNGVEGRSSQTVSHCLFFIRLHWKIIGAALGGRMLSCLPHLGPMGALQVGGEALLERRCCCCWWCYHQREEPSAKTFFGSTYGAMRARVCIIYMNIPRLISNGGKGVYIYGTNEFGKNVCFLLLRTTTEFLNQNHVSLRSLSAKEREAPKYFQGGTELKLEITNIPLEYTTMIPN